MKLVIRLRFSSPRPSDSYKLSSLNSGASCATLNGSLMPEHDGSVLSSGLKRSFIWNNLVREDLHWHGAGGHFTALHRFAVSLVGQVMQHFKAHVLSV